MTHQFHPRRNETYSQIDGGHRSFIESMSTIWNSPGGIWKKNKLAHFGTFIQWKTVSLAEGSAAAQMDQNNIRDNTWVNVTEMYSRAWTIQQTRLMNGGKKLDLIPAVRAQEYLGRILTRDWTSLGWQWHSISWQEGEVVLWVCTFVRALQATLHLWIFLCHLTNQILYRVMINVSQGVTRVAAVSITQTA